MKTILFNTLEVILYSILFYVICSFDAPELRATFKDCFMYGSLMSLGNNIIRKIDKLNQ